MTVKELIEKYKAEIAKLEKELPIEPTIPAGYSRFTGVDMVRSELKLQIFLIQKFIADLDKLD